MKTLETIYFTYLSLPTYGKVSVCLMMGLLVFTVTVWFGAIIIRFTDRSVKLTVIPTEAELKERRDKQKLAAFNKYTGGK